MNPPLGPRRSVWALVVVTLLAGSASAQKGTSVAALAFPADGASGPVSVNVARIADDAFASESTFDVVNIERVLDGKDPNWMQKRIDAERAYKRGKEALDTVELPLAVDAFAESVIAWEQAVPGLSDVSPIVETLVQQGVAFALEGDKKSSKIAFMRALALDPAYRLPSESTPKRVLQQFDAVVVEARTAGQGTLTVYSTASSLGAGAAEVWVDGVFRGIAPFTVDVGAGRHYVRVSRDGYISYGAAVDVKRGAETSVQASLLPTSKLAKLEELATRVVRNKENPTYVSQVAEALLVDRLMVIVVEDESGSALLTATYVDGVTGKQISHGSRAFSPTDAFFEREVKGFVKTLLRGGDTGSALPPGNVVKDDGEVKFLPGPAEKVTTPDAVVGGWVLVGTGAALLVNTIVCGIVSLNLQDQYRNQLASQLDPNLEPIRSTWLTMSIITDASWVVGALAGGTGAGLLVAGYGEQAAQEEVVAP